MIMFNDSAYGNMSAPALRRVDHWHTHRLSLTFTPVRRTNEKNGGTQ